MAKWSVESSSTPHGSSGLRRRESNSVGMALPPSIISGRITNSICQTGSSTSSDDDEQSVPVPAAAMAIPRFRSSRPTSASYDEGVHRRRRTVSNNSVASTSSCRSSFSSLGRTSSFDDVEGLLSDLATATAPRLPPSPYPVDPYHFYCRQTATAPSALVQELRQLLVDCKIEHSFQPYKCKFKCVTYMQYSHVEFIIRVYTAASGALLLEFQRRSGSLLLWDGLYSILYHRLIQWVDQNASSCPQSGAQKKVAPRSEDNIGVKLWHKLSTSARTPTSGVEAMKIMVTSPFLDAQREGCAGLAAITENSSESAFLVAKYGIVEWLVKAAAADDLPMARCAIGALGNVSRAIASFPHEKLAVQTLEQLKQAARVVVDRLGHTTNESLFSLELRRECARALGSFGKICPNEVVTCEGPMQLQHHVNHHDHQLSTLCRDALRELEASV